MSFADVVRTSSGRALSLRKNVQEKRKSTIFVREVAILANPPQTRGNKPTKEVRRWSPVEGEVLARKRKPRSFSERCEFRSRGRSYLSLPLSSSHFSSLVSFNYYRSLEPAYSHHENAEQDRAKVNQDKFLHSRVLLSFFPISSSSNSNDNQSGESRETIGTI